MTSFILHPVNVELRDNGPNWFGQHVNLQYKKSSEVLREWQRKIYDDCEIPKSTRRSRQYSSPTDCRYDEQGL